MKLEFRRHSLHLAHSWAIARTRATECVSVNVITLTDCNGTIGLGEAAPVQRYNESVETVEAFCRRIDPLKLSFNRIVDSMNYLERLAPGDTSAKCAFNIALLDGAARQTRQPVYDFLGLGFREKQHATSFTIGIDQPEIIRQKVAAARQFPVLKMKAGGPQDKENLKALREVAPDKPVRVDANEGWTTKEQALENIGWFAADGRIQFIEQPLPASTPIKDWAWLKQRSPLPIFADESYHLAGDASIAAECFHGVNVKLVKTGGLTGAFAALQAARKAGLKTMMGCMIETSILISAAAQLAELCDFLDLDGNLLITNDPYEGATAENGVLSFANAREKSGIRVSVPAENYPP